MFGSANALVKFLHKELLLLSFWIKYDISFMKLLIKLLLIVLWSDIVLAQQVGHLIDFKTEKPIPYVNMQILGSRTGFTSDENGKYKVSVKSTDSIVLSAIGYKTKILGASQIKGDLFLHPTSYDIPQVNIENEEKQVEIGRVKKQIFSYYYGASNGYTYMIGRFFNFKEEYKETPLLKSIEVLTDSELDSAQFNIRLYSVDSLGYPDELIQHTNIFAFAAKGIHLTKVDIEKLYLKFPTNGLFVAIEWLKLERNLYQWSFRDTRTKKRIESVSLEPSIAVENNPNKGDSWIYTGKWRLEKDKSSRLIQMKITLRN